MGKPVKGKSTPTGEQVMTEEDLQKMMAAGEDGDSVSSESDDDELLLEGELVRNPDVSSSSSDEDDDDSVVDDDDAKPAAQTNNNTTSPKRKSPPAAAATATKKRQKKKSKKKDDDITNVEFIFCDTQEKYWHGCKALLMNSSTVYQRHASVWSDWLSQQVVGTVVSTPQASDEDSVFGFASLVAVHSTPSAKETSPDTTTQRTDAMKFLQQYAMSDCPAEFDEDMKRLFHLKSLYLFLHGRMINLPLEIVLVLHEQLWLDWEYAHEDDSGDKKRGKKKQKSAARTTPVIQGNQPRILRMAPCTKSDGGIMYRYYDDELLAGRAIVSYTVKAPKSYSQEEALFLQVLVLSVENYKQAIDDFKVLVGNHS